MVLPAPDTSERPATIGGAFLYDPRRVSYLRYQQMVEHSREELAVYALKELFKYPQKTPFTILVWEEEIDEFDIIGSPLRRHQAFAEIKRVMVQEVVYFKMEDLNNAALMRTAVEEVTYRYKRYLKKEFVEVERARKFITKARAIIKSRYLSLILWLRVYYVSIQVELKKKRLAIDAKTFRYVRKYYRRLRFRTKNKIEEIKEAIQFIRDLW